MTKKPYCTYKNPKAGLGLRADTRKSALGNRSQSRGMVEALHRKKRQKIVLKKTSSNWLRILYLEKL